MLKNIPTHKLRFHCPFTMDTIRERTRIWNRYHHTCRQQCVLSRNLRIFKVARWHYRCRHHLKNNCIWDNLLSAYYFAAKFTLPVEQPSNKAAKCGIRRSEKLKVKPNLGYCSNIAITISYISVSVSPWLYQDWQSYGRLSTKVTQ